MITVLLAQTVYLENFESPASVKNFSVLVGDWYRAKDGNNYVFVVDGKRWGNKLAGDIKPKIAKLFGAKYYAYLDAIKKYYYFPLAIYNKDVKSSNYDISVRIKPISGKVDQAGGIVFGMKDPGNYLVLRSNHLENNCVLFGYKDGRRYTIRWIQFKKKNAVPNGVWHTLKVSVRGKVVSGYYNGRKLFTLDFSKGVYGRKRGKYVKFDFYPTGKTGLWSKADSKTYFDDFKIIVH